MLRIRLACFVLLILLCTLVAGAQQPQLAPRAQQPQQPPEQTFTITISSQLVIETVMVKDKDGKTIEGLSKDEFTVTEDGVPQSISVFEFQKLEDTPVPLSDGGTL